MLGIFHIEVRSYLSVSDLFVALDMDIPEVLREACKWSFSISNST